MFLLLQEQGHQSAPCPCNMILLRFYNHILHVICILSVLGEGGGQLPVSNNNRLLYEYGEILTRVSIAVTRACECHANANESEYFSIFVQ